MPQTLYSYSIHKNVVAGAGYPELQCAGRGPQLHLRRPPGRLLLHPRGEHQGGHLAGAARQDAADHQGESRPAQGEDKAPRGGQEHQYQGEQIFRFFISTMN